MPKEGVKEFAEFGGVDSGLEVVEVVIVVVVAMIRNRGDY
jgi:hypothetical protein